MMIDYKQLRVGNYVTLLKNGEHMAQVTEITGSTLTVDLEYDGLYTGDHRRFEPIPLTPELLEKVAGFDVSFWGYNKTGFPFSIWHYEGREEMLVQYNKTEEEICFITYLHQLQNLYYSLTGKELVVNTQ